MTSDRQDRQDSLVAILLLLGFAYTAPPYGWMTHPAAVSGRVSALHAGVYVDPTLHGTLRGTSDEFIGATLAMEEFITLWEKYLEGKTDDRK